MTVKELISKLLEMPMDAEVSICDPTPHEAGKCIICGREIKIVTKKHSDELPNIFFCPQCDADNEEWIKRHRKGDNKNDQGRI